MVKLKCLYSEILDLKCSILIDFEFGRHSQESLTKHIHRLRSFNFTAFGGQYVEMFTKILEKPNPLDSLLGGNVQAFGPLPSPSPCVTNIVY